MVLFATREGRKEIVLLLLKGCCVFIMEVRSEDEKAETHKK